MARLATTADGRLHVLDPAAQTTLCGVPSISGFVTVFQATTEEFLRDRHRCSGCLLLLRSR